MSIEIADWGWPQWVYIILMVLTLVANISLHGKERPPYNGWAGLSGFLLSFILLAFGGFF